MDTSGKNSDLMEILIINLGDAREPVDNQILRLMNVLLSSQTDVREKQRVMREEFHIAMTAELEVEVEALCNLSQGIYNEGLRLVLKRASRAQWKYSVRKAMKIRRSSSVSGSGSD